MSSLADPGHREEEENAPAEDDDTGAQVAPIVRLEEVAVTTGEENEDDIICLKNIQKEEGLFLGSPNGYLSGEARIERAWDHWDKIGRPKFIVSPMVDYSELSFRLLCRKYGAQAAYTPMLHSRIFSENDKYRSMEFTTCEEDLPLFVQFCANDPDVLLEAAKRVEPSCDYVDINLG